LGGVSRIVKTASSRGRTGRTLFGHCDSCSPQARPRGAQECCGQAQSVTSKSHYGLLHRTSGRQALMLSRWWAADAQVERMGARPNRAVVVKTALTCGYYSHSSTVLERRRGRMKNFFGNHVCALLGAWRELRDKLTMRSIRRGGVTHGHLTVSA
jgi:hypothetical protein